MDNDSEHDGKKKGPQMPMMPHKPKGMSGLSNLLKYCVALKIYQKETNTLPEGDKYFDNVTGLCAIIRNRFMAKMEELE